MCGFIGIVGSKGADVFRDIYEGLLAIQHRGQDASGAVTFASHLQVKRGMGLVRDVFQEKNVARLTGHVGVGHVRYPTVGTGSEEDIQPFMMHFPFGLAMAHNGNVTNFLELKNKYFIEHEIRMSSSCDLEAILYVFAQDILEQGCARRISRANFEHAVRSVFEKVKGAYSVVGFVPEQGFFAFRDPFGIKPIVVGKRVNPATGEVEYAAASESVVLDVIGFELMRDLEAGEAMWIQNGQEPYFVKVATKPHRPCIFELVYFARPDSMLDNVSVYKTRTRFGTKLAAEWKDAGAPRPDVVIPIPDSARDAAQAMAQELGVPYREALVKNRYIGRTFIMPDNNSRRSSIRRKLNPIQIEFQGKDVLLVDDSLVRGNTSRKIVEMARAAGARKVYLALTSSPLIYPCPYGIDMSTKKDFIAKNRTIDEVAQEIGVDYLYYLKQESMESCAKRGNEKVEKFCTACFDGKYPTGDITEEMLGAIEDERMASQGAE
ncbi:MAG: amidophosphoribosyltransferase [Planctomycetes bacterium]|nr:amidophosphoribosyltransferase [Planctomycetota bacterium]